MQMRLRIVPETCGYEEISPINVGLQNSLIEHLDISVGDLDRC